MKTLKEYLDAPDGRKQMYSDIDEILRWMDFEKIAKVMDFLDWGWVKKEDEELDGHMFTDENGYVSYIPTAKEVMLMARRVIDWTVDGALESEKNGEFEKHYSVNTAGFVCELEIVDDDIKENFWGKDCPDDFEHSVDITLKFVLEEAMGKFV